MEAPATSPVIVIDNGTGFTKLGYAGNEEPTYIIPSTYCDAESACSARKTEGMDDLDFYIGNEAVEMSRKSKSHVLSYPIQHGIVDDWDKMERMWQHCIYKYMRVEPSEYGFILTEPPANPPENREYMAEVMFETFGVKQLHIAVQGVLALTAARGFVSEDVKAETGLVIDSGDGVTHVIPVVDGFVINQAIRHIPLAGRDITNYVLDRLRERDTGIPPEDALMVAQKVKEKYCYVASDLAEEFSAYDEDPKTHITVHNEQERRTGKPYSFEVAYEKFIGPEIFFNPSIFSPDWTVPLYKVVDSAIMSCPIDCRKPLYKNIVLSGGTTLFKGFAPRLHSDLKEIVDLRLKKTRELLIDKTREISKMTVKVVSHPRQRYAVWNGGSVLGASPHFGQIAHSKKEYDEVGPSICRRNVMFMTLF